MGILFSFHIYLLIYKLSWITPHVFFPSLGNVKILTGSLTFLEIDGMHYKIADISRSEFNKLCVEFLAANFPVK